ncbi:MAG: alpha/beta hydrolase [Caldilineaceae bacterium]|nr:alpha/beta hydrolase [Caldilineaceae bacterium]
MAIVVLVHGTTAGGWVWRHAATALRSHGHEVYTPTLTGLGERAHLSTREVGLSTHITDIANVLRYEDLHDVILVGHSYAGAVITGVADQERERLRQLIYLDAVVLEHGESSLATMPTALQDEMRGRVEREGEGWKIPVMRGPNDRPASNTPHPWKSWTEPITLANPPLAASANVYIRCTADKDPGAFFEQALEQSWRRAQARGWRCYEVATVHQILADPQPKTEILLKIVDGI